MADKAISELIKAEQITSTDLFVLEQNGTAKRLEGQTLLNWLTAAADGHGGIQSIAKTNTQGLVDTYTITLADLTTFAFNVTNGKSIQSIAKISTVDIVDTYRINFNDGSSQTFTVTNGEKGDKGDNAYVWIKWASQDPEIPPHSFGDVADNWMGIYSGNVSSAPADYAQYVWFEVKGAKGDTGNPATMISQEVVYQVSDSGTIYPSGAWSQTVPVVPAGKYLWTRTTLTFNSGTPVVSYSVSRMGIDGSGAVSTVNNISPDGNGNVTLGADDVDALPLTGGTMSGPINMNGQKVTGLNDPEAETDAARKGYVDTEIANRELAKLQFTDTVVAPAQFEDNTEDPEAFEEGFVYMAQIPLEGVIASMIPQVFFGAKMASIMSVSADTYNGGVIIYANSVPDENFTIPTILCWRGNG